MTRILVLHDEPQDFREWLEGELDFCNLWWATNPEEVAEKIEQASPEVVFSIKHSQFPGPSHLPALNCPTVKWFHVGGSGTEHLGVWNRDRVQVTNSAGVLAPFHGERAMAALLYLTTGLKELSCCQLESQWRPTRFTTLVGKTLLVVGLGATGKELAKRARAFGMKVIGVRRSGCPDPTADQTFPLEMLPQLWPQADVLSLNVPHTTDTERLLDRAVLDTLKPGCILLNGSRGKVVDQEALIECLDENHLGGVWLDVTDPEPLPPDSPLWCHPKVVITPHCADQVEDFPLRFAKFFCTNLRLYQSGEPLQNLL